MAASLTLDVVTDLAVLPADQWQALVDGSPGATVFQELGWLRAWWATCAPPGAKPWLLTAKAETTLVGVAPLFKAETGRGGSAPRGELRFIGDPHSDYNQLLVADGTPAVYDALLKALDDEVRLGGCATLSDIPTHSDTARALLPRVRPFGRVALSPSTACPRLDLEVAPTTASSLLRKQSFRRHANKLKGAGTVSVEHIQDTGRIREHLPAFFDQHVRRWHATPYPSLFLGDHNRRLYDRLLDELPPSRGVLFTVVTVDGRPAAYHYGFLSGRDLIWYKPAFEIDLADFSPGQALLYALVEWCVANGRAGLDFTRGDEAFKARYANQVRETRSLRLYHSLVGRVAALAADVTARASCKLVRLFHPGAERVAA
jgi:CelD/BcsL family acetyltransferase involved in cellulose biosynthesis